MVKMINRPTEKKYCLYLNHEELFTLITLLGLISPPVVDNILNNSSRVDKYFTTDQCSDLVNENVWELFRQLTKFAEKDFNTSRLIGANDVYQYMRKNNLIDFDEKGDDSDE